MTNRSNVTVARRDALYNDPPVGKPLLLCLFTLLVGLLPTAISHAGEIDDAISLLQSDQPELRYKAARTLRKLKPESKPAIDTLIAALGDTGIPSEFDVQYLGPRVNDAVRTALVKIGQPAVPALISALDHQDKTVRIMAAEALGELGLAAKNAFPALARLLKDPHQWVRYEAMLALGQIGKEPEIVVPVLEEQYLNSSDELHQQTALEALFPADPNGTLAIPILLKAMNNENGGVVSAAVVTLGGYREKAHSAVPHLIKSLSNDKLRWDAYGDVGYQVPVRQDVIRALAEIGPAAKPAVPELARMMKQDENEETRIWAAAAILRIGVDKQLSEDAFAKLVDADAYEALGTVGTTEAAEVLIKILQTEDSSELRLERHLPAVIAIGEIGPNAAKAVPILCKIINSKDDEDDILKKRAVVALGKMGSASAAAIPDLKRMIPSSPDDITEWTLEDEIEEAITKIQQSASTER